MKKAIALALVLFTCANSFSQSTNLDKESFSVSYVKLPSKPILDDSKRTYKSNTRSLSLSGFSRVNSNATLDINYRFNGTKIGEVEIKKTKHEKKDKEGNVTSTTYTYKVHSSFSSSGSISINNSYALENNFSNDYSESTNYESKSFSSYSSAREYYNNNKYTIRNEYKSKHKKRILDRINFALNKTYGYVVKNNSNEYFWILANKKHPEFKKHHEAYETMRAAFEKMKSDEPIDNLKSDLQPVIDYFNSVIPNYPGTKKKARKVKYASYYNIACMYYYMDMPEKAKEYAQKLIENDYDKSDGRYYVRVSDELAEKFKTNDTRSRHFKVISEDLTDQEEAPEPVAQEPTTQKLDLVKAYLVSKEGDTTLVDMETKDISKIAYQVRTVQYSDNGNPIGTMNKSAKKFNEVLFVDGTHYKNVLFKESAVKGDAVNAGQILGGAKEKLCKVLFESDKINLYLFNNQEPVIFVPGSKKGKSTLSTSFVFGFKKQLAKLAESKPELAEKAKNKEFKNNPEDLMRFCKELASSK